jgi:hypothetical protein
MRNDHQSRSLLPSPEAVEGAMRRARQMRSEVVHGYLSAAVESLRKVFRPAPPRAAPSGRAPAPQHC